MNLKNIDFYYFSGTGNTFLIVKKMKQAFEKNDIKVNLYRLEKTKPKDVDLNNTIGLGFPVAEQGTYPFVWDFVKSLPSAKGTDIFLVDTLLAYSGGIVGPMKQIVKRKGYNPIGAKEILMPNNLFPKRIDIEKKKRKILKGQEKASQYAEDIINGKSRWKHIPPFSDLLAIFSKSQKTWKFFRWYYPLTIDKTKCNKCGLCSKICPINNIEMNEYPKLKNGCTICMRCISFCPKNAIHVPKKKYIRYTALKIHELLDSS
ncbi:MAG: 4Fe-4S ferredoxin [Thermoplasmata archaeon]|nr:MAG: 4Fe-4S ferredoxin [Thermoplasmata archaeon]